MNSPMHFRRALAVCFIGLASLALPAGAVTIFEDDFTTPGSNRGGPYTSSLAGTAPKVGLGTWTFSAESGGWGQTGSGYATPSSSNFLPFTPVAGFIYTLTATMDWTSDPGGDRWMVLAFTDFNNHNWNGSGNFITSGGVGNLSEAVIVRPGDTTQTYTVTLDTTAPGWTNTAGYANVGWIMNGAGAANINASRIRNFSLTSGVANPTVTYDGNGSDGGAVPTDGSSPYTHGATVTALGVGTMTRTGYSFIGWNTAADGTGTNYNPGDSFTIRNNTTLYAKWLSDGVFILTYNGNGHTGGSVPVDPGSPYTGGSTVTVLGNTGSLIRTSYTFSGWNTAANGSGTGYSPGDTFTINSNTTLFAQWTAGPDYVWDNGAASGTWNGTDANWSSAVWTSSGTNNAFFDTVGGVINLDTITAGAVNVGKVASNFAHLRFSTGSLSAASLTVQGFNLNSGKYIDNPSLSLDSDVTISGDTAVGRANLNITGGNLMTNRIISAPASADWGRVVVSGGTVIAANGVDGSINTSATFAIDLNGGELRTPSIRVADREISTNNSAWLTFNGGTLKAIGASNANFITTYGGGQNTYVASGGAIIDTNSFNIGILVNLLDQGGGLTKEGAGTLTLGGTNTYSGDTIVNAGTFVLADNARLSFFLTDSPFSNKITGAGTATFNGDFFIDTTAITGNTDYVWTLVDRATLSGESFDDATFTVIGFSDPENDGVWTMTDARGIWSFSEATGQLTLDVSTDFEIWGAPYGLAAGSEGGDPDNDGLTNFEEYAFGLIPNSGASVNPISVPLDKSTGKFSYTRRKTSLGTNLTYSVWFSENLGGWTQDTPADILVTPIPGSDNETVEVTLSTFPGDPLPGRLFIQVRAQ